MLDVYGLHTIIWDSTDERLGNFLVASPADATGRGLELHVRQGGAAADLTGAEVYFLWRHKMAGTRGHEPMTEIDASLGQFVVYYPAAMQEAEGAVDAQFMVTHDGKSISTRAFTIRVEPVIIGGTESEDGFTLFVETIMRYEGAIEITTATALPSSGLTGSQCFYPCSTSLVGGNGTVWASNKTAFTYFRIDTAAHRDTSRRRRTACPSGRASRAERPWSRAARSRCCPHRAASPG